MKLCSFFTGGPLLLTIGVSIFGLADSMTLIVSDLAGVGQFHFMRSFLIALMVFYLAKIFKLSAIPKRWPPLLIRTGCMVTAIILYFTAMPMMPMAEAGAGLFTSPIFVLIISNIFFKERITVAQTIAVALGTAGIILIFLPKFDYLSVYHFFPIFAGALYAMGSIVTYRYLREESPLAILMMYVISIGIFGSILATIFTLVPVPMELFNRAPFLFSPWVMVNQEYLFWISAISILTTVALALMTKAYQTTKTSQVAIYEYAYLLSVGLLNYLIWDIAPTSFGMIGIVLIISAGVVITWSKFLVPKYPV